MYRSEPPVHPGHPMFRPAHHVQRTVNDSTTPSRIYMNNGSETHVMAPIHYLLKPAPWHSRKWHWHVGWPNPNHPDHICQLPWPLLKSWKTQKIDLAAEGYTHGAVLWSKVPKGMTSEVRISTKEKNVVEFDISVASEDNVFREGIYPFAVHLYSEGKTVRRRVQDGTSFKMVEDLFPPRNDIVYLGELVVLPAGLSEVYEEEDGENAYEPEYED